MNEVVLMKQKKAIPGQQIRNVWHIKPQTRIHDNDPRKNKKRERQICRKNLKEVRIALDQE